MIHWRIRENDPLSPQNEGAPLEVWSAEPITPKEARDCWVLLFCMECEFGVDRATPFGKNVDPFIDRVMAYFRAVEEGVIEG